MRRVNFPFVKANNTLKRKKDFREFTFDRSTVDSGARTVEIAFASETPVDRYFGYEILDLSSTSVRLERLSDGGALLLNHDAGQQVGVVEKVWIGADRIARALVRFGNSALANEIFQDVVDGIRRKCSVGYLIYKMLLEGKQNDQDTYRVTDWEPFEISIVAIPADNSVGVGRDMEIEIEEDDPSDDDDEPTTNEPNPDSEQEERMTTPAQAAPAVDVRAIENEVRTKEMKRIADLEAAGSQFEKHGGIEVARKLMAEGGNMGDFNETMLQRMNTKPVPTAEIGLAEREIQQYSFMRAINALANPSDRRAQEAAAFEMEASRAAAKAAGKTPQGILVPVDVLNARHGGFKRDLTVGTASAGGNLVATDLESGSFIDLLRNRLLISTLGARILNGLNGNVAIPRQTGGATAYWVAESGAPTESQQAVDQVTLTPKTVGAYTDMSRKLLIQSSIDVENLVRSDLAAIIALELDRVALYGSGASNQPTGIKNVTGINTLAFGAITPTFAEIIDLESLVATANADTGNLAYVLNPAMRGALKSTPKVSGYPSFIFEDDNTMNGYKTGVSNQVANGDVMFGNWADLLIGFWSGLDLTVDPYTNSTSGTVRIIALQDTDIADRHAVSFARGNHSL